MIARLYRLWRDRHDPALKLQTPVQKFSGYDKALQERAWKQAQGQSETGRPYPTPKVETETVVRFPRRGTK